MARRWGSSYGSAWPVYVPVAERRKQAEKEAAALRKKGKTITPVTLDGKKIASTFWGKAWCDNLESYSDYANRLPRGRSYVRNGSIVHLGIADGTVEALVRGTTTYTVKLTVKALPARRWSAVIDDCSGQVTSLVELLEGKLSRGVMEVVTDAARGIFPSPTEIALSCSCPDWATMCKHVAATMYGVGARLDRQPELLFLLRGVDPAQLIARSVGRAATKASRGRAPAIDEGALGSIFGIEIDEPAPATKARKKPPAARAVAAPLEAPRKRKAPARAASRSLRSPVKRG
ncbi:hypothetical protein BH11MYX4_BH11MYX4_33870 [soil metagenome]